MVPQGHASRPNIQEAHQVEGSKEEEQQLFKLSDIGLFPVVGGGFGFGAPLEGDQQAASRLPGQAVRQGGNQDAGQSDRGRSRQLSGLQSLLPTGGTRKGGQPRSATRAVHPLLGGGPDHQRGDSYRARYPLPENKRPGAASTGSRFQPRSPSRAASAGAIGLDSGCRGQVRSTRVCSREQTSEATQILPAPGQRSLDRHSQGQPKPTLRQGKEGQTLGEGATEAKKPEEGRREPCGSSGARLNHSREEARAREERRIALRGLLHEKKRERAELRQLRYVSL